MATPTKTKPAPEVTPEVTDIVLPAKPLGIAPRPLFQTVVEEDEPAPVVRKLNARTLAEHAAGKAAISQYDDVE